MMVVIIVQMLWQTWCSIELKSDPQQLEAVDLIKQLMQQLIIDAEWNGKRWVLNIVT